MGLFFQKRRPFLRKSCGMDMLKTMGIGSDISSIKNLGVPQGHFLNFIIRYCSDLIILNYYSFAGVLKNNDFKKPSSIIKIKGQRNLIFFFPIAVLNWTYYVKAWKSSKIKNYYRAFKMRRHLSCSLSTATGLLSSETFSTINTRSPRQVLFHHGYHEQIIRKSSCSRL